eukprot:GHVS01019559.1.p1 GENE.GHVS01019559.1~~GHVS01019559.1.p1  ORF type:complete len:759 (+),score=127.65 GHVS01019559.1:214-2490(+)
MLLFSISHCLLQQAVSSSSRNIIPSLQQLRLFIVPFILLLFASVSYISATTTPTTTIPPSFNHYLEYTEVRRIVDLSSRVVKITIEALLTNTTPISSSDVVDEFHLTFTAEEGARIGHIVVNATPTKNTKFVGQQQQQLSISHIPHLVPLPIIQNNDNNNNKVGSQTASSSTSSFSNSSPVGLIGQRLLSQSTQPQSHGYVYTVTLPKQQQQPNIVLSNGGGQLGFTVVYYLGHSYHPLPQKIEIRDPQFVEYIGNSISLSPYITHLQSTAYKLPNDVQPVNIFDKCIVSLKQQQQKSVYVSPDYENILPFHRTTQTTTSVVRFHFRLDKHLAHFNQVERYVEVSHWGNIFFHEQYFITNRAAKLVGEFNRIAYMQLVGHSPGTRQQRLTDNNQQPQSHILFELEAALPRRAFGLEYFDKIGNISSSVASRQGPGPTYTSLKIEPRYPILGGWTADWQIQFNVPIRSMLSVQQKQQDVVDVVGGSSGSSHYLNVTFGSPFRGVFVDEMVTRVALPAGAHNIRISTPRQLDGNWTEHKWSWLDLLQPRPVVGLYVHNYYIPERELLQHKFQIAYDYIPTVYDIQKPLLLCFLIFLPFLLWIIRGRLSLRITGVEEGKQLDRQELRNSIRVHTLEVYEDLTHNCDDFLAALEQFEKLPVRHILEEANDRWQQHVEDLAIKVESIVNQLQPLDECLAKTPDAVRAFGKATQLWVEKRSTTTSNENNNNNNGGGCCRAMVEEAEMYFLKLLDLSVKRKGKME